MALFFVFLLLLALIGGVLVALYGSNTFRVFSLREHKLVPNRLSDLLPWAILIDKNVVFNKNGSFMAVFSFRGPDLASSTKFELMAKVSQLNNVLKRLPGGWAMYCIDDRARSADYGDAEYPYPAAHVMHLERQQIFKDRAFHENRYQMAFVFLPPPDVSGKVAEWFYEGQEKRKNGHEQALRSFQNEVERIGNLLGIVMQDVQRLEDDDLLTALKGSVSLKRNRVRVPEVPMYLDAFLTDTPLTGGLDPKLGNQWIQALTVVGFPMESKPGLLDRMNQLPFEYRWVTRFIFLDPVDADKQIKGFRQRWLSLRKGLVTVFREAMFGGDSAMENTDAVTKAQDADGALQELGNGDVAFGHFTQTILLFDTDRQRLEEKRLAVEKIIDGLGFNTIDENLNHNALDAFLGAIPGNCANNVRHPLLNTLNLVHLFPLSAVWAGEAGDQNLDGTPLLQVVTDNNTPFRLSLNFGDVGHTMIVGPTGAGKTTLLNAMEAAWTHYPNAQVFIFDNKKGSKVLTHAMGGDFYDLGEPDCSLIMQPLRNIDQEQEMSWAIEWVEALCEAENVELTPDRKTAIQRALQSVAASEPGLRTMTQLKVKVQDDAVKQAVNRYTHEGPYGKLLDGEEDNLKDSAWQAFEMRELMKNMAGAVMPTLTYLFHRLEKRFRAATPTLLVLDEAWLMLDNPVFAPRMNEWLRTLRSFKVYVVFASQSPSSVAQSPLFNVINESCYTKIFLPFAGAQNEVDAVFYRRFSLNDKQIELIARATPKREYYVTTPHGNRLFSLPLDAIGLAYCASTGEGDVAKAGPLFRLDTREFNRQFLASKGLAWVSQMMGDEPYQGEQLPAPAAQAA